MRRIAALFALFAALVACAPSAVDTPADAAPAVDASVDAAETPEASVAVDASTDAPAPPADVAADASTCGAHAERIGAACRCVAGYTACDGRCVDLYNDGANCGGCGRLCEGGVCALGRCVSVAPPVDAGSDAGDAAADRPDLCGGACSRLANVAAAECSAVNRCAIIRCATGFADCDTLDLNGCETPLGTRENCGACRNVCSGSRFCAGGECR